MRGFLNFDGPLFKIANLIADIIVLGLLWFVCSIPVVTIGASTTAVYYVMTRRVSDRETYILKDFFSSFKSNFLLATGAFIPLFLALCSTAIVLLEIVVFTGYPLIIYFALFIEAVLLSVFIYPILARFDVNYKTLYKYAFFMSHRHLLTTLLCVAALLALVIIVFYSNGFFLIFAPGTYFYLTSLLFVQRFKKYKPEIDNDELDD